MKKAIYPIVAAGVVGSWTWIFTFDIAFTFFVTLGAVAVSGFAGWVEDQESQSR